MTKLLTTCRPTDNELISSLWQQVSTRDRKNEIIQYPREKNVMTIKAISKYILYIYIYVITTKVCQKSDIKP